jgi:hypothetical protein
MKIGKNIVLALLLCLMGSSLFAQKGLFGLSYGQDLKEARKALLTQGFTKFNQYFDTDEYANKQIPALYFVGLNDYNKNGTLSGWTVYYHVNGDQKLIDKVKAELDALHKNISYHDNVFDERSWELGNEHTVYLKRIDDNKTLVIDYGDAEYYDDWE